MNEYWIDFTGYCLVSANSPEEAKEKFYQQGTNCAINEPCYDVECVEKNEKEE